MASSVRHVGLRQRHVPHGLIQISNLVSIRSKTHALESFTIPIVLAMHSRYIFGTESILGFPELT
jgi:hypothetical protein